MDSTGGQAPNPWFSMWTQPRATIQQIVDTDPERLVLILSAVAGFSETLDRAVMKSLGDRFDWPVIIAIAAVAGPIGGILGLYVGGALIRWTGTWLDGQAPPRNIRAAMAWSSVPLVWALLLWPPELALFGQEVFTTETPLMDASPGLLYTYLAFAAIETTVGVWAVVAFLKCLGQVQGFSAWKALGNLLLAALVIAVPLLVIALGLSVLAR